MLLVSRERVMSVAGFRDTGYSVVEGGEWTQNPLERPATEDRAETVASRDTLISTLTTTTTA
ncbi:hypothetical protein NDI76_15275 [Halogeometricum sp. S1BR25-6]|uniref:Uncharacterized protein n=1 Tax=Halogeometricum salsisoli TaxID=2950536 RepID=A0ABU2GH38_9EURY|nr:hypothetical protein [Halogeometricum sp. S1BR25-6]MDS0300106.1 hypothetical protein [Halogeometricum sp. S1BR25-6]